jgi:WD40 repeat protein
MARVEGCQARGATTRAPLGDPLTGHTGPVWAVACTVVDGRHVAVSTGKDGTVRLWDLTTRTPIGDPLTGHTRTVYAVACTILEGRHVAITTSGDHTVRLWDLTTRTPIGDPLTGHTGSVDAVACTILHGRDVAITGGMDRTMRIWDLQEGRELERLDLPCEVHAVDVDAGNLIVAFGSEVAVLEPTGGRG